jgi:hypothetical protein
VDKAHGYDQLSLRKMIPLQSFFAYQLFNGRISKVDEVPEIPLSPIPDSLLRSSFHFIFFYDINYRANKAVIYSDSNPLLYQDIFIFVSYAPMNNQIKITKTAIPSKHRLLFVFPNLPQTNLGTGP